MPLSPAPKDTSAVKSLIAQFNIVEKCGMSPYVRAQLLAEIAEARAQPVP